jgi:hypothetical protein
VFCGWDFSMLACSRQAGIALDYGSHNHRRYPHHNSCENAGKLGVERVGICGFTNVKTNAAFLASAAIGSLSYVLVYIRQNWTYNPLTHRVSHQLLLLSLL